MTIFATEQNAARRVPFSCWRTSLSAFEDLSDMPGNLIYWALILIVIALVAAFLGLAAWPEPPWAGRISSFGSRSSSSSSGWCSLLSAELKPRARCARNWLRYKTRGHSSLLPEGDARGAKRERRGKGLRARRRRPSCAHPNARQRPRVRAVGPGQPPTGGGLPAAIDGTMRRSLRCWPRRRFYRCSRRTRHRRSLAMVLVRPRAHHGRAPLHLGLRLRDRVSRQS